MTFEKDSIDDDVIAALRADARGVVPKRSRERVLRRLGMNAVTLGATATVATGARALVANVAAHSTTVLVSTLGIGIGIGFSVRSGLDLIRAPAPPVPATVQQTAPSRPSAVAPARAPSSDPASAAPLAAAVPSTEGARPEPSRRASPVARSVTPPASATSALSPPGLAAQQALLDGARRALVRGDGMNALSALGAHRQRFPDTTLAEERAALEIRALLALGRLGEARERHATFERRFPGSLFAPSLRSLLPPAADLVTEPPGPSQE